MAVERKEKKRKAPTVSVPVTNDHPPSKKSKKASEKRSKVPAEVTKPSIAKGAKIDVANGTPPKKESFERGSKVAKGVKPRKRAADFLSDDEEVENDKQNVPTDAAKATVDPSKQAKKKAKSEAHKSTPDPKGSTAILSDKAKKEKISHGTKNSKPVTASPKDTVKESVATPDEDSESEDDQTVALIKGFESSEDEDASGDEGFEPGQEVPTIPDSKQVKRKVRKSMKKGEETGPPGIVYIGRIPHGFYEHEMRAYFTQFGPISRLRLSRNRTTGKSKHFAFVEFASTSVAKIVADTMDNYLMFGHILKCKFVPQDKAHPDLWKGANRRFKKTPWNRIEKRRLQAGKTREQWSKALEKEEGKRALKAEKMKAFGYEYELPTLKGVGEVPEREKIEPAGDATEDASDKETKMITESSNDPKVSEEKKTKTKKTHSTPKKDSSKDVAADTPEKAKKEALVSSEPKGKLQKDTKAEKKAEEKSSEVQGKSPGKAEKKANKQKKKKAKA